MELPDGFDLGGMPLDLGESVADAQPNNEDVRANVIRTMAVMLHLFENSTVSISDDLEWKVETPADMVEGRSESKDDLGRAVIAGFLIVAKQCLWRVAKLDDELPTDDD
ncbi:MAG: hypothetical protein MH825_08150 [Cyanobacteria bacterium]|nr:hypothetical protein [Cyanobacteriota bacterium]